MNEFKFVVKKKSKLSLSYNNCLISISAYSAHTGVKNVHPPLQLDITTPPENQKIPTISPGNVDIMTNINMIHISPWATALVSNVFILMTKLHAYCLKKSFTRRTPFPPLGHSASHSPIFWNFWI